MVIVRGEPGIGKTSLVEAFAHDLRGAGARIAWGRCWEATGAPPLWPWIEIVRSCLRDAGVVRKLNLPAEVAGDLSLLVPELAGCLGVPAAETLPPHDSAQVRFRVFDSVARFLARVAGSLPLAVLIEDLHLADDASLRLLEFVRARIDDWPLLVVATCRDFEMGQHPLGSGLLEESGTHLERIELAGLSVSDVASLLRALGDDNPSSDRAPEVHRASDGNPLMIRELVRAGASRTSNEALPSTAPTRIPNRMAEALRQHAGRLPAHTREILVVGAVIGREFPWPWVKALLSLPESDGISALEPALVSGIIVSGLGGPAHYRFAHAVIRDVVYYDLAPVMRCQLHARVSALLEGIVAENDQLITQLAYHAAAAAPHIGTAPALRHSLAAASHARALFAYELAAEHLRRALGFLELSGSKTAADRHGILIRLAEVEALAGSTDSARASFDDVMASARKSGDRESFVGAVLGCFDLLRDVAAIDASFQLRLAEALEWTEAPSRDCARLVAVQCFCGFFAIPLATRCALSEQATSMARALGDDRTLLAVLSAAHGGVLRPTHSRQS